MGSSSPSGLAFPSADNNREATSRCSWDGHSPLALLDTLRSLAVAEGPLVGEVAAGQKCESPLRLARTAGFDRINAGSDLLSHTVSHAVPSAVAGLTSVFGMGTGVTLLL